MGSIAPTPAAAATILFVTANLPTPDAAEWISKIEAYLRDPIEALRSRGATVHLRTFQDPEMTPAHIAASYTHILFLAADKYNQHMAAFAAFLDATLPAAQQLNPHLRILNPAALVAWNANKTYLSELQAAGFRVPRTAFLPATTTPLDALQAHLRSSVPAGAPLVLKPSIAASGLSTHLLPTPHALSAADAAAFARIVAAAPPAAALMLQEYLPGIRSVDGPAGGEWSIILVNGRLTHAVRKRPRPGEFRINSAFGGLWVPMDAGDERVPQAARDAAREVWRWLVEKEGALKRADGKKGELLYARVDGVLAEDGAFVLMEIELIEPYLWLLGNGPGREGLKEFCDAVLGLQML